jgi:hypothetical protein
VGGDGARKQWEEAAGRDGSRQRREEVAGGGGGRRRREDTARGDGGDSAARVLGQLRAAAAAACAAALQPDHGGGSSGGVPVGSDATEEIRAEEARAAASALMSGTCGTGGTVLSNS